MITDQDAEDAVEFLENNAIEAAQARADRIYCEQFRNTVKAQLMTNSMMDPERRLFRKEWPMPMSATCSNWMQFRKRFSGMRKPGSCVKPHKQN